MRYAGHITCTLTQSRISQRNGGISAKQQLVNRLTLLQARQCTILPQNRSHIGRRSKKSLMSAHQCTVAKLKTLIHNLPELIHISLGRTCHIHQIDRNNSLVETSVVLRLICLRIHIWCQETPAAHAGITMSLAILVHLQFQHLLLRYIIRNKALCGTLCRKLGQIPVLGILMDIILLQHIDQFRECRCNVHTLLILHTLNSLVQHLLNDCCQVRLGLSLRHFIQIHEYCDKRRLSVCGHKCNDLILDHLHTAVNLFLNPKLCNLVDLLFIQFQPDRLKLLPHLCTELFTADLYKRSQVGQGNTLSAILRTGDLRNSLCGNVAGSREALRRIDHRLTDDRSVLKHIL